MKNAAAPKAPSMAGGVKDVRAALHNARRDPSPTVTIGRINFFIRGLSAHGLPLDPGKYIMRRFC